MKIGILGAGFMGTTHARAYAKVPGNSIAAAGELEIGSDMARSQRAELQRVAWAFETTLSRQRHPCLVL